MVGKTCLMAISEHHYKSLAIHLSTAAEKWSLRAHALQITPMRTFFNRLLGYRRVWYLENTL